MIFKKLTSKTSSTLLKIKFGTNFGNACLKNVMKDTTVKRVQVVHYLTFSKTRVGSGTKNQDNEQTKF